MADLKQENEDLKVNLCLYFSYKVYIQRTNLLVVIHFGYFSKLMVGRIGCLKILKNSKWMFHYSQRIFTGTVPCCLNIKDVIKNFCLGLLSH